MGKREEHQGSAVTGFLPGESISPGSAIDRGRYRSTSRVCSGTSIVVFLLAGNISWVL